MNIPYIKVMDLDPRLLILSGVFAALVLAELIWHARPVSGGRRWLVNLGLAVVNMALVRLLAVTLMLSAAAYAQNQGWGLFNLLDAPFWLIMVLGVLAMECTLYWQHRLFHTIPFLWRWHALHHRDEAMDITTGVRFHPLEAVLSSFIKVSAGIALGLPPLVMLAFETLLTAASLWEHANIKIARKPDLALRGVFVTPAMHLVHHHDAREDHDTNYGFFLSIWDHLFGTYKRDVTHSTKLGL